MPVLALCLGYPRIGVARELKKALESYWAKKMPAEALLTTAAELRRRQWLTMKEKCIDQIPSSDFSLYDSMLDTAIAVGAVPERYRAITDPLTRYFAMARGLQDKDAGIDVPALEMTKWFDTNYHYIVPEIASGQDFKLDASKIMAELEEARALGIASRPVIPGPVTFLLLSKLAPSAPRDASALDALLPIYEQLLGELAQQGVAWVQLDEPCLVTDLTPKAKDAYRRSLQHLSACKERPRVLLATYFGALGDNLPLATESGCEGLHFDLVRAPDQIDAVLHALPSSMHLSLGLIDGRNIWRTDLDAAHAVAHRVVTALGSERVLVAPSCSLLHVPVDLAAERKLDGELKSWLAFAVQKLDEIRALADAVESGAPSGLLFEEARRSLASRRASLRTQNPTVCSRVGAITEAMLRRTSPFFERIEKQRARFSLPVFPTTTIGSFPQTSDVRSMRAAWRAGRISDQDYDDFLKAETKKCVEKQEQLGLDVLVHGEFERADMVEYFGEQLDGFAFTEDGWGQSYGSRCVKPPLLFGDVARHGQ